MTHYVYLLSLIVSLAGLAVVDFRFNLALKHDTRRTLTTVGAFVCLGIVWDLLGIASGIFSHGKGRFNLPYEIVPSFPVEEIFFLGLLGYVTLILYLGMQKLCSRI